MTGYREPSRRGKGYLVERSVSGLAKEAVHDVGLRSFLAMEGVVIGQEVLAVGVVDSVTNQHAVVGLTNNTLHVIVIISTPHVDSQHEVSVCSQGDAS